MTNRATDKLLKKRSIQRIRLGFIFFAGSLQVVNHPDEFFAGMRDCDILMLTLFAFLLQIIRKVRRPIANELCRIKKSISEVCL